MTDEGATKVDTDAAIAAWRQGDCVVGEQWFVFRKSSAEDGLLEEPVAGLVVVSQTCDVVRKAVERPYVEVAPLVKIPTERTTGARLRVTAFECTTTKVAASRRLDHLPMALEPGASLPGNMPGAPTRGRTAERPCPSNRSSSRTTASSRRPG